MILHILNKGPSDTIICTKMNSCVSDNEAILLIEDGIYHCLNQHPDKYDWLDSSNKIYVLENDAKARGVCIPDSFTPVSYEEFVELTIRHSKTISWY